MLHMVCDGLGRPLTFFLSPGQMSDAKGTLALLSALRRGVVWRDACRKRRPRRRASELKARAP